MTKKQYVAYNLSGDLVPIEASGEGGGPNVDEEARAAAARAQATAEGAQTIAETADSKAVAAQGKAEVAQSVAEGAQVTADTAQLTANTAEAAAGAAQTTADIAQGVAENAQTTAQALQTDVITAQNTANAAKTTAETALEVAAGNVPFDYESEEPIVINFQYTDPSGNGGDTSLTLTLSSEWSEGGEEVPIQTLENNNIKIDLLTGFITFYPNIPGAKKTLNLYKLAS